MLKLPQRMNRINPNDNEEFKEEDRRDAENVVKASVHKQLSLGSDIDICITAALVPKSETFSIFSNKKHHINKIDSGEFPVSVSSNSKKMTQSTMLSSMMSTAKKIMNSLNGSVNNSSHGVSIINVDVSKKFDNNGCGIHAYSEGQRKSPEEYEIKQDIPVMSDSLNTNSIQATSATSSDKPTSVITGNVSDIASFRSPRKFSKIVSSYKKRHISRERKSNVFSERSNESTPSVHSGHFSHDSNYKIICKHMNPQLANEIGVSCRHSFVESTGHPLYVAPLTHGLENSPRIIPNYYLTTNMKNGLLTIDYHFTIMDDIRNIRPLNPAQLKYIEEKLSDEKKQKIIVEFNRVMGSFCVLLHHMD